MFFIPVTEFNKYLELIEALTLNKPLTTIQMSDQYKRRTITRWEWYNCQTVSTSDQYKRRTSTNVGMVQKSDCINVGPVQMWEWYNSRTL